MAIKRKTEAAQAPSLPAEFLDRTRKAFTLQAIAGKYEEAFKGEKEWIVGFLESTDEISVTQGEGIKTPDGLVNFKSRDNWKIDTLAIADMIAKGELNIATILEISSINAKKLQDVLGKARFEKVAVNAPSEHLALTATPDFKASIEREFNLGLAGVPHGGETEKELVKPAAPSLDESVAKATAAAAKAKKFSKKKPTDATPESDLDAILKEKNL